MNWDLLERVDPVFGVWQRSLVPHKEPREDSQDAEAFREPRNELDRACEGGLGHLSAYLRRELSLTLSDNIEAPNLPRRLTGPEIREMPIELESEIGSAMKTIPVAWASRPAYWLICHIDWVQREFFEEDLHSIFMDSDREVTLNQRTRNFLRRTGGLPHIRGTVSVFSDCPIARGWWRSRIALDVSEASNGHLSLTEAHKTLHASNQAWEELVRLAIWRLTVISHPRVRAAIVNHMALKLEMSSLSPNVVKEAAVAVARHGMHYSLHHLTWDELRELIALGEGAVAP